MELDDIIEAASSDIKGSTLVLHRSMKIHPKFKVYKRFCYDLYSINSNGKNPLLSCEWAKNTTADQITETWSDCDKLYLRELIKWLAGEKYKSMKDGV